MQLSVKPKADLSHNPFDTANRDVFSLKTGMITPCLVKHTIPDSMYDCSLMGITRTIPVQSAPFTRMSQNFEYYFIPYSQIFHDFERIYYERGEEQRNISGLSESFSHATQLPCFSLKAVLLSLFTSYVYSRLKLIMKYSNYAGNVYFRSAIREEYYDEYVDIHGRSCAEDMLRIFDMLGYGNYLPVFKAIFAVIYARFDNIDAEDGARNTFFSALKRGDFSNWDPIVPSGTIATLCGRFIAEQEWVSFYANLSDVKPNIFAIAAYVKVWSDFYRNSQYDINENYAKLFNFDFVVDDSLIEIPYGTVCSMLIPRYRQYKKDMFTGGYPSAQFGSVAVSGLENPSTIFASDSIGSPNNPYVFVKSSVSVNPDVEKQQLFYGLNGSSSLGTGFTVNSSISALSIRQSLAMQRYKERILRAGNRTRSLQSAVFGDKSRYVGDLYVDFLGSQQSVIDFNSVASTASTDRSELGELGSNGVSSPNGKVFEYHSHDFGIILGVTYVLPESEYEAYMIDYFNTTSESHDFYKPDFMNLGLQEVYNFHFNYIPNFADSAALSPAVLNYLSRYWPYKVAVDKVHGEFYSSQSQEMKPNEFGSDYREQMLAAYDSVSVGAFAEMVTPRKSNSLNVLTLPSLYVSPTDVDRIFYQISDTTQASDQFKCAVYHDFKSVLPMSVVGLPSL